MPLQSLPLNQYLYDRLEYVFESVLISGQGEALQGSYMNLGPNERRFYVSHPGEYYRICCPYCFQRGALDTRHRLWINHRWGVGPDGDPRERFWHLAICYNENCLAIPEYRKDLRTKMYHSVGREARPKRVRIRRGRAVTNLDVVQYPGRCARVDQLRTDHHAVQYLTSRGFDHVQLGTVFKVCFCEEPPPTCYQAACRLIIPIFMRGQLVSWQGRYVGDIDWNAAGIPKYVNCPRTNKSSMLYGFDDAVGMPFCIVVEGVSDVWAIGAGAIALLGKTMSQQQFELIRSCWQAAVIVLDNDAESEAEHIRSRLAKVMPAARVSLPPGADPATMGQSQLWDLIYQASANQGIDLCGLANVPVASSIQHPTFEY